MSVKHDHDDPFELFNIQNVAERGDPIQHQLAGRRRQNVGLLKKQNKAQALLIKDIFFHVTENADAVDTGRRIDTAFTQGRQIFQPVKSLIDLLMAEAHLFQPDLYLVTLVDGVITGAVVVAKILFEEKHQYIDDGLFDQHVSIYPLVL